MKVLRKPRSSIAEVKMFYKEQFSERKDENEVSRK